MELEDLMYIHSGKYDSQGIVYMSVLGILGVVILGFVYGIVLRHVDIIYIDFILTAGFGGLIGYALAIGATYGNVRNQKMVIIFALISGLLAEYFGWVTWIFAVSDYEVFSLSPSDIFNFMGYLAEEGSWSIFGWTPTGFALYFFWLLEAVLIIGASIVFAVIKFGNKPFCEECHRWVDEKNVISYVQPIMKIDKFLIEIIEGNFDALLSLNKVKPTSQRYTEISILRCSACDQHFYLSVNLVTVKIDDGKKDTDEEEILRNLIITREMYDTIMHNWKPQAEAND